MSFDSEAVVDTYLRGLETIKHVEAERYTFLRKIGNVKGLKV